MERVVDLLAMHRHIARRHDAQAHLVVADVDHGDRDVVVDDDGFVLLARHDQHGESLPGEGCELIHQPTRRRHYTSPQRMEPSGEECPRGSIVSWTKFLHLGLGALTQPRSEHAVISTNPEEASPACGVSQTPAHRDAQSVPPWGP